MGPDPEPISCIALNVGQRAVIGVADSNRPNFADLFEVERRQSRIRKPEAIS